MPNRFWFRLRRALAANAAEILFAAGWLALVTGLAMIYAPAALLGGGASLMILAIRGAQRWDG